MDQLITFKDILTRAAQNNKLLALKCQDCGAYTFPPKIGCAECASLDCREAELAGQGVLKTFTVVRVPPEGINHPYAVGLVELDEGPWVMARLAGGENVTMDVIGKRGSLDLTIVEGDQYSGGKRVLPRFHFDP